MPAENRTTPSRPREKEFPMSAATRGLRHTLTRTFKQLPGVRELIALARRNAPVLSEGEVAQFHADGYTVIDPQLPGPVLDRAVSDLAGHPDVSGKLHHGSRVFNGWKLSRAIRAIALAPRDPQEGAGADLGGDPAARRERPPGQGPHPPQPGDALLLRGLPALLAALQLRRLPPPLPRRVGKVAGEPGA